MKWVSFLCLNLALLMSGTGSYGQAVSLTFSVDMKSTGLLRPDSALDVGIRGSLEPLSWINGIRLEDKDRNGIYSATIDFEGKEGQELIFKYILNDVEWESGENFRIRISRQASPPLSVFRYSPRPGNPFRKFFGEWTMKNDDWEQGSGKDTGRIRIPNHRTLCREVNTDNSLLMIVHSTAARGHILWTYNHAKQEVRWLSSFYSYHSGTGEGSVNKNGDVTVKVHFEGAPEGTYRIYTYTWISDQEYLLRSLQYDRNDKPTGDFYGGRFVRVK